MEDNKLKELVSQKQIWLMFGLAILLLLWGNHAILLWNQDEAAYAGFGSNMLRDANWLIPEFAWSDAHRKTPLHFWLISISYLIFGENEFAVRFSSSAAILGTLAVLFYWGRSIWGEKRMLVTCYVLMSSILFMAIGKVAVTDATLLFFETICALSIAQLIYTNERKWVIIFWSAIAFGMLTKGPPIVIFAGTMGLLLILFHPDGRRVWQLKPWFYFPLAIIPLFLWGYMAWQRDAGVFINWLLDWYILKRLGGNVFGQTGPPGYYVVIFLASFIIWLPFVLPAIFKSFKRKVSKHEKLWAAWLLGGWFLYEILSSKLPAYTIAAHPAVAIAIATLLLKMNSDRSKRLYQIVYFILSGLTLIGIIGFALTMDRIKIQFPVLLLLNGGVILFLVFTILYWQLKTGAFYRNILIILPAMIIFNFYAWSCLIPATQSFLNGPEKIIHYLEESEMPENTKVYLGNLQGSPPSLPLYIENVYPEMEIESDTIKVFEAWYNTPPPAAFILSELQVSVIERLTHPIETQEITTYLIDRQNRISYFVVLKK